MLNATPLPVDDYGNPQPIGCHKTRATQKITLTSNAAVYASTAFTGATKTMASITLESLGSGKLILTSKLEGYPGEEISVEIGTPRDPLAVMVTEKNIFITPTETSTILDIIAAIQANPQANALVSCSYLNDGEGVIPANQARAFLNGWDSGGRGLYVRVWCDKDAFIGTFSEAETTPQTASMPITAKTEYWEFVFPGHKIAAKSPTSGAIIYMTPAKQM